MKCSMEWKPISETRIEPGTDIRVDTRDFRCITGEGNERNLSDANDTDALIGRDEIKDFLLGLMRQNTPEGLMWWKIPNLKYIYLKSFGDMWEVEDRHGNPIKWREI